MDELGAHWHFDLAGPFTASDANVGSGTSPHMPAQYYVFIAVEAVSRWTELLVIPDKSAYHTSQALYTSVLSRHGNIKSITSDNGDEWGGPFHRLLISLGIKHIHTAPRHPQSNGIAESAVRKTKRTLEKLCRDQPSGWVRAIPKVQYAINMHKTRTTGHMPYELIYGRKPHAIPGLERYFADLNQAPSVSHVEWYVGAIPERPQDLNEQFQWEKSLIQELQRHSATCTGEAIQRTRTLQDKARTKSIRQYEEQGLRKASTVSPGDAVLLLSPSSLVGKRPSVSGPFYYVTPYDSHHAVIMSGAVGEGTAHRPSHAWIARLDSLRKYHF